LVQTFELKLKFWTWNKLNNKRFFIYFYWNIYVVSTMTNKR
jgi:hypothetical protein